MRTAEWGMLYADDAGIVSKLVEGLAEKMMTTIVTVFEETGFMAPEKNTERNNGCALIE